MRTTCGTNYNCGGFGCLGWIPQQGAHARAECPTPAAKSAPSGAHSAQITQVCEWRTRPIAWPSRRRNRFLNSGLRFLTLDARPPRARTLPKPQINFHSRLERRFQNAKTREHQRKPEKPVSMRSTTPNRLHQHQYQHRQHNQQQQRLRKKAAVYIDS